MIKRIFKIYSRNQSLVNNIVGSYFIKGAALIVSFFTLPAFLGYFQNNEVLGMWFTIVSVLQWILMFDFGLGNGLRNKIVPLLLSKNYFDLSKHIISTYFILGILSIIVMLI